ncbi:MAG: T9SS type A sorting domain-containing protein [Bacteroidetes bacterium]|nr:T9SS type A sorting domain-containing protein [Bacteroidota bacterium]
MRYFKLIVTFTLTLFLFCTYMAAAQDCSVDSLKTNKLYISTGIGANAVSDSVLLAGGYGGNSGYPTPNNNIDTFWSVSKLSSNYNPRATSSGLYFTYTGTYLTAGGNPYVMADTSDPLYGYWAAFGPGGTCISTPGSSGWVTNWISVYMDAGGQNANIVNATNDGYAFDRCFYVCTQDSLSFHMQLLADDIIDSVLVDTNHLYITPSTSISSSFYCSAIVTIDKKLKVTAGRHIVRVWIRDNAGGHIGLNVYGTIASSGSIGSNGKTLFKSKYDSKCSGNHLTNGNTYVPNTNGRHEINISPNPSNGDFNIFLSDNTIESSMEVYDYSGRNIMNRTLQGGNNNIHLNVSPGIYLLRITNRAGVIVKKIVIQ